MDSLIFDRTQSDVTNKTSKGYYNASDLNRVESWCRYLADELNSVGYNINITTKTTWSSKDLRTASEMERIRQNIKKLMNGFHYISTIYANNNNWNYLKANRWEKILYEIDNLMLGMEGWYVHCGVSRMGQSRLWQNRFRCLNYEPVDYIQTSGTQYINTSFYADNNTRIETAVSPTNIADGDDWQCVFSSKTAWRDNEYVVQIKKEDASWYTAFGSNSEDGASVGTAVVNTIYYIDKNKNVTNINGNITTMTDETFTATQPRLYIRR